MAEATDYELLSAWKGGDEAAGNRLVRRHFSNVYGFIRSKIDDRPEDLVQRTFLLCLEHHDRFWESASFRAFLFGIARRVLFKHFDELARGRAHVDIANATVEDLLQTPSKVAAMRQEHKLLFAALRKIPLDFQITIELFYWEGAKVQEIAEILQIQPGTVKSRLNRARGLLREALEGMDVAEELRRTTLDDLSGWARSLQRALSQPNAGTS